MSGTGERGGAGPALGRRGERGSATIEALFALPVFIFVALAFAFLLRCVQAHEMVQHAITQAAEDIAESSYIYDVAGLLGLQRDAEELAGQARSKAEDAIGNIFQLDGPLPDGQQGAISAEVGAAFDAVQSSVNGALFSGFAGGATDKYLAAGAVGAGMPAGGAPAEFGNDDNAILADAALRRLSVVDGLLGLDFSESTFLDSCDDVVIRVRYRVALPIFIESVPSVFEIRQQARARAWLFGERREDAGGPEEDGQSEEGGGGEGDTIWSLGNFERGQKIRELFGGNLPTMFPVISGFTDGEALLVKSLDATAATYQDPRALKNKITGYINSIAAYEGQERPFGDRKTTISPESITSRRLVLVIPTNELPEGLEAVIEACVDDARSRGVEMQVERYERKIMKEGPELP